MTFTTERRHSAIFESKVPSVESIHPTPLMLCVRYECSFVEDVSVDVPRCMWSRTAVFKTVRGWLQK